MFGVQKAIVGVNDAEMSEPKQILLNKIARWNSSQSRVQNEYNTMEEKRKQEKEDETIPY